MMNLSFAGLLGAIAGTFLAAVIYHPFIDVLDREVRKRTQPQSVEERATFEVTMSLLRRVVLAVDLLIFAGAGYWLGHALWD